MTYVGLGLLALATVSLVALANMKIQPVVDAARETVPTLPVIVAPPTQVSLLEKLSGANPVSLVVIGDSTGAQDFQWVNTLGRDVSQKFNRPLDVATWSNETNSYGPVTRLAEGTGAVLSIWNGSASGKAPAYSQANLATLVPKTTSPDAIIVSHGHNTGMNSVLDISRLTTDITQAYPVAQIVLTVQNPQQRVGLEVAVERARVIREWAEAQRGWIVSDVFTAFESQPDMSSLYLDDRHPNAVGGQLWANTTETALNLQ